MARPKTEERLHQLIREGGRGLRDTPPDRIDYLLSLDKTRRESPAEPFRLQTELDSAEEAQNL